MISWLNSSNDSVILALASGSFTLHCTELGASSTLPSFPSAHTWDVVHEAMMTWRFCITILTWWSVLVIRFAESREKALLLWFGIVQSDILKLVLFCRPWLFKVIAVYS